MDREFNLTVQSKALNKGLNGTAPADQSLDGQGACFTWSQAMDNEVTVKTTGIDPTDANLQTRDYRKRRLSHVGDDDMESMAGSAILDRNTCPRFNPRDKPKEARVRLPVTLQDYVDTQFSAYIEDKMVKETVLEDYSIPDGEVFQVREVDKVVTSIMDKKATSVATSGKACQNYGPTVGALADPRVGQIGRE